MNGKRKYIISKKTFTKVMATSALSLSLLLSGSNVSYADNIQATRNAIINNIGVESKSEEKETKVIKEKNLDEDVKIKNMYIKEKGANILKDPFDEATVLSKKEHGTKVSVLRQLPNGWNKVEIGDTNGYVKDEDLIDKYVPKDPAGNEYKANTIYLLGKAVPYKNTGQNHCQSQIDNHPETAATFGGAATFSGKDNHNTHFAAHNFGAFKGIWNMPKGSTIVVTDGNGQPFKYSVNNIKKVTYEGYGYADGVDYWNQITGHGSQERITLQTCIFGDNNGVWIVDAHAVK